MKRVENRGVRPDSLTSQLRALAKQKPRKRLQPLLEPLPSQGPQTKTRENDMLMDITSLQKQVQSPLRLQWLVDDFVKAAGTGDLKKVDQYIRGGIPIDRNHSVLHYSALHAAAALEKDEITKVLVQAGANVNAMTKERESALHMAARYGKPAVAQEILRHSAEMKSPNHVDSAFIHFFNLLHHVCILDLTAGVFGDKQLGLTPMEIAADRQDHELERLLEPPPNAPTAVHTQAVSSTSLTVAWTSSCSAASSYLFKVTWLLCESAGEFTEECSTPFYRICNLLPASRYQVMVQAGNHTVGWSESSPPVISQTDGDAPNALVAPTITEVSDCFIRMRIQLTQSNGSEITRVSIQSQCTGAIAAVTTSSFRRLLKPQDYEHAWESIISDVGLLRDCDSLDTTAAGTSSTTYVDGTLEGYKEFVSTGLAPGRVYYFRVKAWNLYGWSPDGEISDGICTNDCPKMVTKAARSMQLVWAKPYSTEHVDCYELQARVSTSTKWEPIAFQIAGQSLDVQDLIPATAYRFRIVPHYAFSGWGDAQKATCSPLLSTDSTSPEPPVKFRVLDRTAHSIAVLWGMPRCNGHIVESYSLQYRVITSPQALGINGDNEPQWIEANGAVPVDFMSVVVDNLERGRGYEFRVNARNSLGEGAFLYHDHLVWTYSFLTPTAPVCVSKTSFSIRIEWQDGQQGDDLDREALVYDVQLCQVESSAADPLEVSGESLTWTVVGQSLIECSFAVSGLSPLGCYVFRIRAQAASSVTETEASTADVSVFSPVSSVFQTQRRM